MSDKRELEGAETSEKKRRSHYLNTIEEKMEIIELVEGGQTPASVARFLGLSRSTVASILKKKTEIKEYVRNAGNVSSKIVSKRRGLVMEEMERSLTVWIEDQNQKNIQVCFPMIKRKALSLYEDWRKRLGEEAADIHDFQASRGWFVKFKNRSNLDNLKFADESVNTDEDTAQEFVFTFSGIITEEGGYPLNLIFNVDETELFWKKMPDVTYLAQEEAVAPGHKASKDRLTLLLGGNAAGDFKIKPMAVYHSENPRALKGKAKNNLPVIWKSNSKSWVTASIFQDWFSNYFVPAIKLYCHMNQFPFKAILLLDCSPGHQKSLQDLHPEIRIVFLPPNTTCEIQPMNQTVVAIFKRYYMRNVLNQANRAIDKDGGTNLKDFWKGYNILNALNNIGDAWDEIDETTMNGCWKKLFPYLVPDIEDFEKVPDEVTKEIVNLMNELELGVSIEDVNGLIDSFSEPLSNEDLIDLQEANKRTLEDVGNKKTLTVKKMREAFMHLDQFLSIVEECDTNVERSSMVRRAVEKGTACYRLLYQEKKRDD